MLGATLVTLDRRIGVRRIAVHDRYTVTPGGVTVREAAIGRSRGQRPTGDDRNRTGVDGFAGRHNGVPQPPLLRFVALK